MEKAKIVDNLEIGELDGIREHDVSRSEDPMSTLELDVVEREKAMFITKSIVLSGLLQPKEVEPLKEGELLTVPKIK